MTQDTTRNDLSCASLVPKSSRFLKKNPSKRYYCPYYIKPKQWGQINNAPEFDESSETQRIINFYYHMHDEVVNPNPFIQKHNAKSKSYFESISKLPPIQKYKQ